MGAQDFLAANDQDFILLSTYADVDASLLAVVTGAESAKAGADATLAAARTVWELAEESHAASANSAWAAVEDHLTSREAPEPDLRLNHDYEWAEAVPEVLVEQFVFV